MTKLPEITLNDWLEAEEKERASKYLPQPKGSYTPEQYAAATNRKPVSVRSILLDMVRKGRATREKWLRPTGTVSYVYFLKK